ncbi:MAG: sulfotransferase [Planctomycetota bacterium]
MSLLSRVTRKARTVVSRSYERWVLRPASLRLLEAQRDRKLSDPPTFLLGPPRCGSTLFYQALIHRYRFGYFQNRMMDRPSAVPLITSREIPRDSTYRSDFRNSHGATTDASGPHEAFPFWRRFYPRRIHDEVDSGALCSHERDEIRHTVRFLEEHFRAPFVSKNLEMSLRLRSLQEIFPRAAFVLIRRDPRSVAASILNARRELLGDENAWWSMRPASYESARSKRPWEQVAEQIISAYEAVRRDLRDPAACLEIDYEEFCDDPSGVTDQVAEFLRSRGVRNLEPSGHELPPYFARKRELSLQTEERKGLEARFEAGGLTDWIPFRDLTR